MGTWNFRPPPGWPQPPPGWRPPEGWEADPSWPAAPPGWDYWVWTEDRTGAGRTVPASPPLPPGHSRDALPKPHERRRPLLIALEVLGAIVAVVGLIVGWLAWVSPDPSRQLSSPAERRPYIEQVDAYCSEVVDWNDEQLLIVEELSTLGDQRAIAEWFGPYLAELAVRIDDLREEWQATPPPREADMQLLRPMLDELESIAFESRRGAVLADSVLRGIDSAEAITALESDIYESMEKYRPLAREYGFDSCTRLAFEGNPS